MNWQRLLLQPDARLSRWLGVLAVALPLVALLPKYFVIRSLYPVDASIFDLGFGFADYLRSLFESGEFKSCTTLPFATCHPGVCTEAARMPVLPGLVAALGKVVGTSSASVAIAKAVILAIVTSVFLRVLTRDYQF